MSKSRTIKVVYLSEQSIDPEIREISTHYKSLQSLVEGYLERIEPIYLGDDDPRMHNIDIWLNEEGKLEDRDYNLFINHEVIVGPVFAAGREGVIEEDIASVPDDMLEGVINYLKSHMIINSRREAYIKSNDNLCTCNECSREGDCSE